MRKNVEFPKLIKEAVLEHFILGVSEGLPDKEYLKFVLVNTGVVVAGF